LSALGSAACSGEPVDVGQSPEMLWWTDHETGDLSDWTRDGGSTWTSGGGKLDLVSTPVRSGHFALRSTVSSNSVAAPSAGIAIRSGLMPNEACYSAWFFIPTRVTTNGYWLIYKFRSRSVADQPSSDVDMWDLDVVTGQNQALVLSLYRHDREEMAVAESVSVPVERWFQLESCLLAANDSSGHLRVWLDGASAFELTAQLTMPSQYVEWNVGSIGEALNPVSASVYVDDAAVSTRPLGPNFPVFWRAP
jgi:hypothetical protein